MSALLAAVLAAFALPSFASSMDVQPADSGSAPPKADPGYPKPRLSEAETRRGMQCGSGKGPSEAECFKLRKKAFEEGQDRLDYERAHRTPADRKLAERASRELDSGKDDVDLPKLVLPSKNRSLAEPNGKGACKMVWKVVGDESSCHAEGRNLIVNPGVTSEQLATGWTDPKTGDNSFYAYRRILLVPYTVNFRTDTHDGVMNGFDTVTVVGPKPDLCRQSHRRNWDRIKAGTVAYGQELEAKGAGEDEIDYKTLDYMWSRLDVVPCPKPPRATNVKSKP